MTLEFSEGKVLLVDVEQEMRRSYIDYAMSVNVDRALPDVRDGLKPVQRRILYTMLELGLRPDRPHKKSARVVGDCMGKYHPHGDMAIYDAMVRMAQDFSYRYMLVDGHGNFGSVDGDPPAAQRYTEARLSKLALEMVRDLDKDTVDFVPNFDESMEQPAVLPSRFPNLLVNGTTGIGVGMATNIPPHNLGEVIDGCVALIDNPEIEIADLMRHVKGPDFPTAGLIMGREGIRQMYRTGRGSVKVRARVQIEQASSGKSQLVITELPYMVNKADLITKIADLHKDKRVDGITALRDESDRKGMRVVIELRRDANPHVVLNQLYKYTQMQDSFAAILLALVDGEPKVLSLKDMLGHYIEHQRDVIVRRTQFELRKAEERAHILEGYRIALDHIDEIIALIRAAANDQEAKEQLMSRFGLSERQAVAILDMQLRRLTGLERDKIEAEYQELVKTIARLREILADMRLVYNIVKEELTEIKQQFADTRRTEIAAGADEIEIEDLIAEEDIVVTLTHQGYIKRLPTTTYRAQKRGGRGVAALSTKETDFVEQLFITTTHTSILFLTNKGCVYRLKGHEIPEAGRSARGTAIINLIPIEPGESVTTTLPVQAFDEDRYLMCATRRGVVKKTPLSEYDSHHTGLIGINLDESDELVGARITDGRAEVILVTRYGQAIRFSEEDVRPMGRATHGVKGIVLDDDDVVIGMDLVQDGADLLVVSNEGHGKRTPLDDYRSTGRGGKGIKTLNLTGKNGAIAGIKVVRPGDEVMLLSFDGIMIRMAVDDVSQLGRNTQGVRVMKLGEGDKVVAVAGLVAKQEE